MKTKSPKCFKCGKVMKSIYTKESYKMDGKYRTFWSKKGYICNHTYYPVVILTFLHKDFNLTNYLMDVFDVDLRELLSSLRKLFNFLI